MTKKIPIKIDPCPIIEAVVDFRFDSEMPADAIFGIIYKSFRDEFHDKVEKLPILQIPEAIRSQDPNFRFQPYYRFQNENYLLQIGPRVINFINQENYLGWDAFYSRIKDALLKVQQLELVTQFNRLGIRYINMFPFDIYDRINLEIFMSGTRLRANQTTVRTTIQTSNFTTNLQIANNAQIATTNAIKAGSVIDIDTYIEHGNLPIFLNPDEIIGNAHNEEKRLFFDLLKDDLIAEMNPVYAAE